MRPVVCSLAVSLDGFVVGPDGSFDWGAPSEDLFRFSIEETRLVGVHLLGRRLYETMLYWEDNEPDGEAEREFRDVWLAIPKVVFSSTLTSVRGNARLAELPPAEEIARLRAEPGDGYVAVGGPTLVTAVADLVEEYRIRVVPVLVGGGLPFFPRDERRVDLELVESRTFSSGVVFLHHRVHHRVR
jgi:dihydrofolate reductase